MDLFPWRHMASDILNDLIVSILIALTAAIAFGIFDRLNTVQNVARA